MMQAATAVVMVLGAVRAEAQLPTVQQVFDKYATAVGGRDAWAKVSGRTEKGTADITFANISGSYERYSALPNKTRMIIDLQMVKIDQGFDGEKGWMDQGQGPQRMPAEQEKNLAEPSANGASFLDPSRYAKATVEAKETVDGVEAYKLAVTSKAGIESLEYFEVATGLRIATISKTPMGEQKISYKDYKDFEGKKIATKVVQATPQGDVILNIQTVTFGTPDAAMFKAPDSIK
jgi:hypothetical protein